MSRKYEDYVNEINTERDLEIYKKKFESEIERKMDSLKKFIRESEERLQKIKEWEKQKNYTVRGCTYKSGRDKIIVFTIQYPDNTCKTERYSFSKISEMKNKLDELKKCHLEVDWSEFKEEI